MRGIIFDLDGVLVFTDKFHYLAWKELADSLKIPFDESMNNRLRGVSRMESLEIILENDRGVVRSETEKKMLAEKKNRIYQRLLEQMTPADVSDEVRNTLTRLREKGYLLAVGSSSKNAKYIMRQTKITEYFDAVSDGTNIKKSKPDPEVFLKAAFFLDLKPEECVVVEDADAGIAAAKTGNMEAIGIGANVMDKRMDYHIQNMNELLKIF
ncbi:MAG: beta-phosphoglucomutase [Lachnospiraceae bacterium]|nr:beta-phosphoglucomutase [Lachnospiraceae bacterium]